MASIFEQLGKLAATGLSNATKAASTSTPTSTTSFSTKKKKKKTTSSVTNSLGSTVGNLVGSALDAAKTANVSAPVNNAVKTSTPAPTPTVSTTVSKPATTSPSSVLSNIGNIAGTAIGNTINAAKTVNSAPTATNVAETAKNNNPISTALNLAGQAAGQIVGNTMPALQQPQPTQTAVQTPQTPQAPQIPIEYINQIAALTSQINGLQQQLQQPKIDYSGQIQQLLAGLQSVQQPQIPQYQSQYNDDIEALINQFNSRPSFSFDATNNPAILAQQKKAADAVSQEMARRNILNSSITGNSMADRIGEVYATLAPQLEAQAYDQYQDQGNSILQQLQNFMNLENKDYSRYMDSYNVQNQQNQNKLNQNYKMLDLITSLQNQDYAKTQDAIKNAMNEAQYTGLYNPYAAYTGKESEVAPYTGNIQAEIDRRKASADTSDDALIPYLENARFQKIQSTPELKEQYGDQYKTPAQRASDLQNQIAQEQARIAADPNSYENQMKALEYAKMAEELNQLSTFGPQEQQLKLQEIESRIKENTASASASYALAEQRKNNPTGSTGNNGDLTYKDYYNYGKEMVNAGNYDSDEGKYMKRYTNEDIYNWVKGLPLTPEQKAKLANDIGLKEPEKPNTQSPTGFGDWLGVNGLIPR